MSSNPPIGPGGFGALLQNLQQMSGTFDTMQQQANTPDLKIVTEHSADGTTWKAEGGEQELKTIMDTLKNYSQVVDAYQKEIARLSTQQQHINPILNVLATIGGATAMQDRRLPPIVRALGESSRLLNPTYQELEDRKLAVAGRLGELTEKQQAVQIAAHRTAQEAQMFMISEARRQREEERRLAADKARVEHEDKMAAFAQKKMELDAQMKQAAIDSAERRQLEHDKTLLESQEIRERAMMERFMAGQEAAARKAAGKEMEVPKTIPEKLANLSAAEKSLDNIENKIRKYSAYQGQVAGRTYGPAKAYFDRELEQFYTNLQLEVAQTIKSTGAGARGFGPMERGFFEKLATAKTHSPAENLGIIDAWRQYIQQNRSAYADVYKGLVQPQYRKSFGKDADTIFGEGSQAPISTDQNQDDIDAAYAAWKNKNARE